MNNTSGISLHGYATYTELFVFPVSSIFQRSTDKKISAHTWILHEQDFCLNKPCRSLSLLLTPHAHLLLACSCSHCRNTKRALNASVLNTVNTTHQPFSFKCFAFPYLSPLYFPFFPASLLSAALKQWPAMAVCTALASRHQLKLTSTTRHRNLLPKPSCAGPTAQGHSYRFSLPPPQCR